MEVLSLLSFSKWRIFQLNRSHPVFMESEGSIITQNNGQAISIESTGFKDILI